MEQYQKKVKRENTMEKDRFEWKREAVKENRGMGGGGGLPS